MSAQTQPPPSSNGHHRRQNGVRTYLGSRLEDVIPKIRTELGPDAIILREREGLMGGINGFFAQRFIEVEARAGAPKVDMYDDEDEPQTPAARPARPVDEESFASHLELASAEDSEQPEQFAPPPSPTPVAAAPSPVRRPEPAAALELSEPAAAHELALPEEPAEPVSPAEPVEIPAAPVPTDSPSPRRSKARAPRRLSRSAHTPASPSTQIDGSAAGAVARDLIARGISETWTHQLISSAAAHCIPFAHDGGLADAVRSMLSSSIMHCEMLPIDGAAVAFVGAGGAGKTRCAAALATAYRRASTLSVSAISFGGASGRRQLGELLRGQDVPISASSDGRALARKLQKSRAGSLTVIDTEAVAPSDGAAVAALANELQSLELDAIYVALPATIGAESGRRLLAGLAPLRPTAVVITHADETDQLGIAIELACASGTPIAFVHDGLDLQRALSAPNAPRLARRLLP